MSYIAEGAAPIHMPTKARQVFDVSGAGDTVIAAVACCRVNGLPIEQTMRIANLAAGVVVGKAGAATVSWEELREDEDLPSPMRRARWPYAKRRWRSAIIGVARVWPSASPTAVSIFSIPVILRRCATPRAIATGSSSA